MASGCPNFSPRQARLSLRSLASDTGGAALIEITLFMPMLALMAVAIINFGFYFSYQTQVVNAAQAGAQWAITNAEQNGYSSSSSNLAGTGANNSSLPSVFHAISVNTTQYCGCPPASSGSPVTLSTWTTSCALGAACSDGSYPGTYVQVVASGKFTPFANFGSFFPSSYSPSSTATVRVQ